MFEGKKGLSPMAATSLLVIFALILGTITMGFGRDYVDKINVKTERLKVKEISPEGTSISVVNQQDPLAQLQVQYLTGKISKEEYLRREKEISTQQIR